MKDITKAYNNAKHIIVITSYSIHYTKLYEKEMDNEEIIIENRDAVTEKTEQSTEINE